MTEVIDTDSPCAEEERCGADNDIRNPWKILIVDDEEEVHRLTRMVLADFRFEGRALKFLSAFSGREGKSVLQENPDIALILLDVVMETDDSGLNLVKYIRGELDNSIVQIVLRTGQPGLAPPKEIVAQYEINGYNSKVEMTAGRMFSVITSSLRAYRLADSLSSLNRKLETELEYRRMAEARIRRLSQFQENVIDNADIWLHVLDENGCIVIWNKAAERISGYSKSDVVGGRDVWMKLFTDSGSYKTFEKKTAVLIKQGDAVDGFDVTIRNREGRKRIISWTAGSLCDENGKPIGLTFLGRDVTEQKELEMQLHQSQKMDAVGRMAGGVAHDFNNMLTVIRGYCELILIKLAKEDPVFKKVELIDRAAERAESLTRQLLSFSRHQVVVPKVIDLGGLVSEMEDMVGRLIPDSIILETRISDSPAGIRADSGQIEQAVMNLVVNAKDAMPDGGVLEISVGHENVGASGGNMGLLPEGRYVVLSVSDNGFGMDEKTRDLVFEPFFTTKNKSTGLGLSIVYGIVRQNGGHIRIESGRGKGTTVRLFFPQVDADKIIEDKSFPLCEDFTGGETVLIVEDQAEVLAMTSEALGIYGYNVLKADTPLKAIDIFKERGGEIDLVLTDIIMPGMSGIQMADIFRKENDEIEVLFMSGYTDNILEQKQWGLEPGRNFIQKPFSAKELLRMLRLNLDE